MPISICNAVIGSMMRGATSHELQGSDVNRFGRLLGWRADDPWLADSAAAIRGVGTAVRIEPRAAACGCR